jgi:hypothetical protein
MVGNAESVSPGRQPNCRIEGTVYGRIRPPPTAPHAERWALESYSAEEPLVVLLLSGGIASID